MKLTSGKHTFSIKSILRISITSKGFVISFTIEYVASIKIRYRNNSSNLCAEEYNLFANELVLPRGKMPTGNNL